MVSTSWKLSLLLQDLEHCYSRVTRGKVPFCPFVSVRVKCIICLELVVRAHLPPVCFPAKFKSFGVTHIWVQGGCWGPWSWGGSRLLLSHSPSLGSAFPLAYLFGVLAYGLDEHTEKIKTICKCPIWPRLSISRLSRTPPSTPNNASWGLTHHFCFCNNS